MSLDATEGHYNTKPKSTNKTREEYMRRAEHCSKMAKVASNLDARALQHKRAAEWLKLANDMES
jgi:hypothetical protein